MRRAAALLGMDLRRSRGILLLAMLGLFLMAALLSFLLGFYRGVEKVILPSFLPLDRLELRKKAHHLDLGPLSLGIGSERITQKDLENLGCLPGLREIYPGLNLAVPAVARGGARLLGSSFSTELAVQGLDPALVRGDVEKGFIFESRPENGGRPCRIDGDCPDGLFCAGPRWEPGLCREPIPVLISPRLIRLFNSGLRKAYHLPRLNPESLIGLSAEVDFGASTLGGAGRGKILRDHLRLVGYSERATPIGISIPLEEVRRVHRFFGEGMQEGCDTVVLLFDSLHSMSAAARHIPRMGFEAVDAEGSRLLSALLAARVLLLFLASVLLFVAALGIFQAFAGLLERRREEIASLQAVGASRMDILLLFMMEGALGGFLAAVAGILLGRLSAAMLEAAGKRFFASAMPEGFFLLGVEPAVLLVLAMVLASVSASTLSVLIFFRRERKRA